MPVAWIRVVAIVIAIMLATLTYFVIEPPLRYGSYSKAKAVGLFVTLLIVGGLGLLINRYNGIPTRFETELDAVKTELDADLIKQINKINTEKYQNCLHYYPDWAQQDNKCFMDPNQKEVEVNVFGDSHSGHLLFGLEEISLKSKLKFNLFSASCQIPLYGLMSGTRTQNQNVNKMREKGHYLLSSAFDDLINNPYSKVFVFAHSATCSYQDTLDTLDPENNTLDDQQKYRIGMERTINILSKARKKVLFVLDNPILPFNPNRCDTTRPFYITPRQCRVDRAIINKEIGPLVYNSVVKEIAKKYDNVDYIDLSKYFCDKEFCYLKNKKGLLLYRDKGHLNEYGSQYVAPYIYEKVKNLL